MNILVIQLHCLNGSLLVYIWHNNHDIILFALCETIFTNKASHIGHHITPSFTSWTCTSVITLRSLPFSELSSLISLLVLNLIFRWRVLPLVLGVYGIFLKFSSIVIQLGVNCIFLKFPKNPCLVFVFTNWIITCDLGWSSVRYHFFIVPPYFHWFWAALILSMFIISIFKPLISQILVVPFVQSHM